MVIWSYDAGGAGPDHEGTVCCTLTLRNEVTIRELCTTLLSVIPANTGMAYSLPIRTRVGLQPRALSSISRVGSNPKYWNTAPERSTIIYCETQISKKTCIEICKSNNPAISGGYNTPPLGAELGSRACPGVHTRDCVKPIRTLANGLRKRINGGAAAKKPFCIIISDSRFTSVLLHFLPLN